VENLNVISGLKFEITDVGFLEKARIILIKDGSFVKKEFGPSTCSYIPDKGEPVCLDGPQNRLSGIAQCLKAPLYPLLSPKSPFIPLKRPANKPKILG
jgi:hypothetical protein